MSLLLKVRRNATLSPVTQTENLAARSGIDATADQAIVPNGYSSNQQEGGGTRSSKYGAGKELSRDASADTSTQSTGSATNQLNTAKKQGVEMNGMQEKGITLTSQEDFNNKMTAGQILGNRAQAPIEQMSGGQAQAMGQATGGANVAAEIGHNQAESAIGYTGTFLYNFTVNGGNEWNRIRDQIFVPMGILFLLPGAVISQTRAIMAAGNPVLGQVNPFDGIFRSIVAIFLIPGTYLVMNYGIDVANSITHTISSEYSRLFGSDMYREALCHEIKAMPYRLPEENRNAIDLPMSSMGIPLMGNFTPFAMLEAELIAVKIWDPCVGVYIVPEDRADEVVPAAVTATRLMANSSNAGLVTSWNILCAFQMAYLYYLWCVGPCCSRIVGLAN